MTSEELVLAVAGEAKQQRVALSKTKLLKLLYLIDIEFFRTSRRLATGWDWRFLHFGPWTPQYDTILSGSSTIELVKLSGDKDTFLVESKSNFDVSSLEEPPVRVACRRVLSRWMDRDLGEILDFVYFDTEPMQGANRGDYLSFDSVVEHVSMYSREPSKASSSTLKSMRTKLGFVETFRVGENRAQYAAVTFTPPNYDEAAIELLNTIDDD